MANPLNLTCISYISPPSIFNSAVISNTTAETPLIGHTIPAGYMPTFSTIGFKLLLMLTTAAIPPTLTINLKFGPSSLALLSAQLLSASVGGKGFIVEGTITNQASQASQVAVGEVRQPNGPLFGLLSGNDIVTNSTWTVDSTIDQIAQITAKFGTANAGNMLQMARGAITFG